MTLIRFCVPFLLLKLRWVGKTVLVLMPIHHTIVFSVKLYLVAFLIAHIRLCVKQRISCPNRLNANKYWHKIFDIRANSVCFLVFVVALLVSNLKVGTKNASYHMCKWQFQQRKETSKIHNYFGCSKCLSIHEIHEIQMTRLQ